MPRQVTEVTLTRRGLSCVHEAARQGSKVINWRLVCHQ